VLVIFVTVDGRSTARLGMA